ncbi:hypothetical protein GCM10010299_43680 [Streptomyces tanashiensis]|nr:hypothetical protein GCM10010299_43680 [Streptomyces tanashiensis]
MRDLIHRFNEIGLACLDPRWLGGRTRLLNPDDEAFVVATATTRPTKLGRPFTRWSIRKLAAHLRHGPRPDDLDQASSAALPARPPRRHPPTHQDVEGVHRP